MDRRWFILRVLPGREENVSQAMNFPVYYPVEVSVKFCRRHRVRTERSAAFYPGYVFGLIDGPVPIHSRLVRGYLQDQDRNARSLSETQVQDLKTFEEWWNGQLREKSAAPKQTFVPGEQIKFQVGPFRGRKAIIDTLQGDYGLAVTLTSKKNPYKVQTEVAQVQKIPAKMYGGKAAA